MKNSTQVSERLKQLFEQEQWTEEDKVWVLQYLETTDNTELRSLMEEKFSADSSSNIANAESARLLSLIHEKIDPAKPAAGLFSLQNWKRLSIAATIVLVTAAMAYLYFNDRSSGKPGIASGKTPVPKNDAAPGRDNATLTLSDGSTILLDSAANGTLAEQGDVKVLKANGQISYAGNAGETVYNTMATARGNQYHLQLADGSKVWLNAASTIRFPTGFTGKERRVEITGEVYFEVAPDATRPFTVAIGSASGYDGGEVQVLGTHFNINAYDDEISVRTTLAEGKVKVSKSGSIAVLQPLQQAVLEKEKAKLKVRQADLDKELAWKTGMFEFQDDDLPSIMRQLSRWYDVDVSFAGPPTNKLYNGSIRRQATLSQVLQILKLAGVSYVLEGKKLTVSTN